MACGRRTELTIATPNTGAVEKDLLFTSEEFACQLAYHEPLFPLEPKRLAFRRMSFTARSISTWSKQVGPFDFASPMGNLEDAMKLQYGFALTAIAGVIVGGAAVQYLHAQSMPPIYYVAELNIADPEGYMREYAPKEQALTRGYGGRRLAAGQKVIGIEGDPPSGVIIELWESIEKLQTWRASADYRELRQIGEKYGKFRTFAVEGFSN